MKFSETWTGNWQNAIRGLRHPMESYDRSDSEFGITSVDFLPDECESVVDKYIESWDKYNDERSVPNREEITDYLCDNGWTSYYPKNDEYEYAFLGPNDIDLAKRMIAAGTPNDKFLRQIFVSVDITAPLFWWKEMDTYKVGTTANSTSTMHKITSKPITLDCFEIGDLNEWIELNGEPLSNHFEQIIKFCEDLRQKYLETKDIRYWKELIRWLPESWLQTRTWTANYAVLRNIIHWRSNHKLDEWKQFVNWCKTLPYNKELLFYHNKI